MFQENQSQTQNDVTEFCETIGGRLPEIHDKQDRDEVLKDAGNSRVFI